MTRRCPGFLLSGLLLFAFARPAPAADAVDPAELYGDPIPHDWSAPAYPPEALKAGVEGRVTLTFVVDAEGKVVDPAVRENKQKPVDPRLQEAALASARAWTFGPALEAGKAVPRAVGVNMTFYLKGRGGKPSVDLPRQPDVLPTRAPKTLNEPDPDYPDELFARKLPGEAEFEFQVTPEGRVGATKVLFASDAAFVGAGLETLKRWTFEPARQGPLPVVSSKRSPMQFYVQGDQTRTEDIFAANGVTGLAESSADKPPQPLMMFEPVYPRARAMAGETGDADVEFVIGENGRTADINIMSASQPEFGVSLAAAVATWVFRPATKSGERVMVTLRVKRHFALKESGDEQRVATALKTGIDSARGLDRSLAPLWRVPPIYPPALLAEKPEGEAMIEFVIDRAGRVRLPQVASATHEAFGWAAATALSQWVFEPPMRHGEAVDVRVSIPVKFSPPTD